MPELSGVAPHATVKPAVAGAQESESESCSLARRPRILRGRQRALTLQTAPAVQHVDVAGGEPLPPMPSTAPERPSRSPLRAVESSEGFNSTPLGSVEGQEGDNERRRQKRGSSVPREAYRLSYLSTASSPTSTLFTATGGVGDSRGRQPAMHMQTALNFASLREARQRLRDSHITTQSSVSLYPPSSSTDSPPSPRSLVESLDVHSAASVVPTTNDIESNDFDPNDVDGRLRLLLNNQYFLPPAHAKPALPTSSTLPPVTTASTQSKSGFFAGIFRPRSKSKSSTASSPATPRSPADGLPALRTTGEHTSAPLPPRPWTAPSRGSTPPRSPMLSRTPVSRVAVVRETLDDLVLAAQVAERDLHSTSPLPPPSLPSYVDPTDVVDTAVGAAAPSVFGLAVQTSARAGLGVDQSIGAAVLADRLVPPGTPGHWSLDPHEEAWRSTLLSQAVSYSLNSTPAPSAVLHSPRTSSSPTSPTARGLGLEHRIIHPERLQDFAETDVPIPPPLRTRASAPDARAHYNRGRLVAPAQRGPTKGQRRGTLPTMPASLHPLRVDSPHTPLTPLAPPPHKFSRPPMRTSSPSPSTRSAYSTASASPSMRRAISSPHMHDSFEYTRQPPPPLTPPPFLPSPHVASHVPKHSLDSENLSVASYVEDEELQPTSPPPDSAYGGLATPRSTSGFVIGYHDSRNGGLGEYEQPSPTASAFMDGRVSATGTMGIRTGVESEDAEVLDSWDSAASEERAPSAHKASASAAVLSTRIDRLSRDTPPPRVSSSLAHIALAPPPPRKPSPRRLATAPMALPSSLRSASPQPSVVSSDPGHFQPGGTGSDIETGDTPFMSALDLRGASPASFASPRASTSSAPGASRPSTSSLPHPSPYLPRASTSGYSSRTSVSTSSSSRSHSRHRRNPRTTGASATLQIPGSAIARTLADVPANPITFFDAIQGTSGMDGYQTWSDGEEDDDNAGFAGGRGRGVESSGGSTSDYGSVSGWRAPEVRPHPPPSPVGRSSLGAAVSSESLHSPVGGASPGRGRRSPVGNVAPRQAYFKETRAVGGIAGGNARGGGGIAAAMAGAVGLSAAAALPSAVSSSSLTSPSSTSLANGAQPADEVSPPPSSDGHASNGNTPTTQIRGVGRTPSMLRLDGLLVRHMAAEREALSRIAASTRSTAGSVRSAE